MPDDDVRAQLHEFLAREASESDRMTFSHFTRGEGRRAADLATEMSEAAQRDGLAGALTRAETEAADGSLGLAKHALKLFVTHDPEAAEGAVIPSPEATTVEELPPPEDGGEVADAEEAEPAPTPGRDIARTTPAAEAALDWYREDPLANDHHHHWHIVYPTDGAPGPGSGRTQSRQGELFLYMHQQMLARYDTERRIAGLPPTTPLDGTAGVPVREGYALEDYAAREPGRGFGDVREPFPDQLRVAPLVPQIPTAYDEIETIDGQGKLTVDGSVVPVDENLIGAMVESSDWWAGPTATTRGDIPQRNVHGNGHVVLSCMSDFAGSPRYPGPMFFVETAIRDPVFYRWHRHIDDLYARHQDRQPTADLTEFAAAVSFRRDGDGTTPDIVLARTEDVPAAALGDLSDWAAQVFGEDLATTGPRRDELLTRFVTSTLTLSDVPRSVPVPPEWLTGVVHLTHDPFVTVLRLENTRATTQEVTVRLFLALDEEEVLADRRMWVELDKFRATLDPGANVVARADARSSVIKRKGLRVPGAVEPGPQAGEPTVWCDCGWPYSLLLPSGASTASGSGFVLVAVVTDWERDDLDPSRTCGSMSFCGARNGYPDERRMGYPFERPFDGPILQAFDVEPSVGYRRIRIRCATTRPT